MRNVRIHQSQHSCQGYPSWRCYINKMAAHNQYRNIDARAHINVQMKSAEIHAH
jgi:hypothetical protein